jgi:hypothetical protein
LGFKKTKIILFSTVGIQKTFRIPYKTELKFTSREKSREFPEGEGKRDGA